MNEKELRIKGFIAAIGDRAPTYKEWKELIAIVEKPNKLTYRSLRDTEATFEKG